MNANPRRWYQFSLRTMFVGMTLACVVLAWVGYSLNWIRERHAMSKEHGVELEVYMLPSVRWPDAPCGLWIFGEHGRQFIYVEPGYKEAARKLFPEAHFVKEHELEHPRGRQPKF